MTYSSFRNEHGSRAERLRRLSAIARFGSFFFGWGILLLVFCFKLPEISASFMRTVFWLAGSVLVAIVYSLPPRLVRRYPRLQVIVLGIYAVSFVLVCVVALRSFQHLTSSSLLIRGSIAVGDSRAWAGVFFSLLGVGSLCGLCGFLLDRRAEMVGGDSLKQ